MDSFKIINYSIKYRSILIEKSLKNNKFKFIFNYNKICFFENVYILF